MVKRKILAAALLASSVFAAANAQATTLYSNGPLDGNTDAWTINQGFQVADSFTLSSAGTARGATFAVWLFPGDTAISVDWTILDDMPGIGNVLSSGTATTLNNFLSTNIHGLAIYNEGIAIGPQTLAAGTYWFELQNLVVNNGDQGFWDINGGPSRAWESDYGSEVTTCPQDITGPANNRCSDTFEILDAAPINKVPEPSTLALLGAGLAGLGASRRRKAKRGSAN